MPKISYVIGLGDSLSDRGTMNHRKLFGFIPMSELSGLSGKSPMGRFTNGYTWFDQFLHGMLAGFNIAQDKYNLATHKLTDAEIKEIAEEIFANTETAEAARQTIDLTNDGFVFNRDYMFARTRCEGGLTAHSWAGRPSYNPVRFITRFLLSTLETKRHLTFADDQLGRFDKKHKEKTLVIEWSGANDLMTANAEPSKDIADLAITARIKNIKEMMKNDYHNFVLFNLPDLSLTPRYQRLTKDAQNNAYECCEYFNQKLHEECEKLQAENPNHTIRVFDVNKLFTDTYNQTKTDKHDYFSANKLRIPFTETRDCVIDENGNCNHQGYMFWDDVHPTEAVHGILAEEFYKTFPEFFYSPPASPENSKTEQDLLADFMNKYNELVEEDTKTNWFASFRLSDISKKNGNKISLSDVLEHALLNGGNRSYKALLELGLINTAGELNYMEPALRQAMKTVIERQNKKPQSTATAAELVQEFMSMHTKDLHSTFFKKTHLLYPEDLTFEDKLEIILEHALYNNGKRSLAIIQAIGWIDKNYQLNLKNDALSNAYSNIQRTHLNKAQQDFCRKQDEEFIQQLHEVCRQHNEPIIQASTPQQVLETIYSIRTQITEEPKSQNIRIAAPSLDQLITEGLNPEVIDTLIERRFIMRDPDTKTIVPLHPSLAPTVEHEPLVSTAVLNINH